MVFKSKRPDNVIPEISIFEFLFEGEKSFPPEKPCVIYADDHSKVITFGELKNLVLRFGASLERFPDFERGDTVAVYSPNDLYFSAVLHGAVAVGGTVATIDHTSDVDTTVSCIQTVNAKYMIAHPDTLDRALKAAEITGIPLDHVFIFGENEVDNIRRVEDVFWGEHQELATPVKYTAEELASTHCYYYYTSGTTGPRKAVILTQKTIMGSLSLANWLPGATTMLAHTEFHHASSLIVVHHMNIACGFTTYIMKSYSLEKLLLAIQECKVSGFATQPWVASSLLKESIVDDYDLSSLQWIVCGGCVTDKDMCAAFFKRFKVPCIIVFAMTEMLGCLDGGIPHTLAGKIGTLSPNVTAKIIDDNGKEVGYNQTGELIVKGPTLTPGYYNNPEANAAAFDEEGFYHTGDLVQVDENEVFTYIDRKKDVFKYQLHHIAPQDIEAVLLSHPAVIDCAAVGFYSEELSYSLPRAFVMLTTDTEHDYEQVKKEILEITEKQLSDEKQLRGGLYILKELPRNSAGKVFRRELRNVDITTCIA